MTPGSGWQAEPPSRQDAQHVSMGEDEDVAIDGPESFDETVCSSGDVLDRLAVRPGPIPDRPSRVLLADVGRAPALERPVVPLAEVWIGLRVREAGNPGRVRRTGQRARDDEHEPVVGQASTERPRLVAPGGGERDVRSPRVATVTRPFGLAVPNEPDLVAGRLSPGRTLRVGVCPVRRVS